MGYCHNFYHDHYKLYSTCAVLWDDYLVAGVEYFQLRVDHSAQART